MLRGWDEGYEVPSLGLCVRPGYQGKGLGPALTYHLLATARLKGARKMILKVKRDNPTAIAMYAQIGFALTDYDEQYLRGTMLL